MRLEVFGVGNNELGVDNGGERFGGKITCLLFLVCGEIVAESVVL